MNRGKIVKLISDQKPKRDLLIRPKNFYEGIFIKKGIANSPGYKREWDGVWLLEVSPSILLF